jgi:chitin synthase
MIEDDRIAGCCGEIVTRSPSMWSPIETAQVVEYKFAHIFDKALESLFGYITVLPEN